MLLRREKRVISLILSHEGDHALLSSFLKEIGYEVRQGEPSDLTAEQISSSLFIVDEVSATRFGDGLVKLRERQLPLYLPIVVVIGHRSSAAPWLKGGFDDVLRMPLDKEELDARLQILSKLRENSEETHKQSNDFVASTLDALSEQLCVANYEGNILLVNQAWRDFMVSFGKPQTYNWEEANYFTFCEEALWGGTNRSEILEGFRAVASKRQPHFAFEYQCNSGAGIRWFLAKVTSFTWRNTSSFVISHTDVSDIKLAESKLDRLARYDSLTGLPNREHFYDQLSRTLFHASRNNWAVGLLFVDLDHFKIINDTLGHGAGDEVLREVANRLSGCVRSSDLVGRLGGDEFAVYLPTLSQGQDAGLVAEKIVAALSTPLLLNGSEILVTASVGISLFPADGTEISALINAADTAMYHAKELGRSNFQYFTADMIEAVIERAEIIRGLHGALERGELFLVYQPQLDVKSGRIRACEALMRWRHPEKGIIPPSSFIPIAEETGLIKTMGAWALEAACKQNKAWQDSGLPPIVVAVNLSAKQFMQSDVAETVHLILGETKLSAQYLELEVTESSVMEEKEKVMKTMGKLKSMGVRISIDDFGTGFSNLSHLRHFPIDSIKIDKSFVADINNSNDRSGSDIVHMMITLGHSLKLEIVAEGVESEAQLRLLASAGCDVAQGFYVSVPLEADCLASFLHYSNLRHPPP